MSEELSSPTEQAHLSRRTFLKRAAVLGSAVVLTGTGLLADKIYQDHERQAQKQSNELDNAKALAKEFSQGVSGDWIFASVWPGLAIISSDVRLFGTPTLNNETQLSWPKGHSNSHLIAQRPFFAKGTAQANLFNPDGGSADVSIGPEVLALWLPDSNDLVYCDRASNSSSILLPTTSSAKIYDNNYQGIVGEQVNLEPAARSHGLVWRYLEAERVYSDGTDGLPVQKEMLSKVCGRSMWGDPAQTAGAYYVFETGQGNDLIQLPQGVR